MKTRSELTTFRARRCAHYAAERRASDARVTERITPESAFARGFRLRANRHTSQVTNANRDLPTAATGRGD